MALNFIPRTAYTDVDQAWSVLVGAANFWDSVDGDTAIVGDLTISRATSSITIAGYGRTASFDFARDIMAASTETSLIVWANALNAQAFAIEKDEAGHWVTYIHRDTGSAGSLIVPDVGSTSVAAPAPMTASLTQLVPAIVKDGTYVFSNIFSIITHPGTYVGKAELNGQKYVMAGAVALAYTE